MKGHNRRQQRAQAIQASSDDCLPKLRHITPFATDADWALTLQELQLALAERIPQAKHHINIGIRTFSEEIQAHRRRRQILEDSVDPGSRLRPKVELSIQARIHVLSTRRKSLEDLLAGRSQPTRAHIAALKTEPKNPDAEHREAYVRAMVDLAVWVIRRSKFPKFGAPAGYQSSMPDPVLNFWDAFGREGAKATREFPTAAQLSQADQVIFWFYLVDDLEARNVLYLRHIPLSWRKVGEIAEVSHTRAMILEREAVGDIIRKIDAAAS